MYTFFRRWCINYKQKFLSHQLIKYYEEETGQNFDTNDIVEFVDIMSSNPIFSRANFDNFVQDLLSSLRPEDHHKTILSIKWREIITTNFDLLLEQTYDEVKETSNCAFKLIPVRSNKEYNSYLSNDEVRYVKLNGCLIDKSKYPLVFSTDDFKKADSFYKKVFNPIKNLSPKVNLLSVGYSYSDPLAKIILEHFDKHNYRNGKLIYSLDPYVSDFRLEYYEKNRVCIIKLTAEEFFKEYKLWEEKTFLSKHKDKVAKFTNSNNERIKITNRLSYNIASYIEQLNNNYNGRIISEKDFYLGEEPNYIVIKNSFDIIRSNLINSAKNTVLHFSKKSNDILPIVFLTGSFGIGKTTFNYRLIHEIVNDSNNDTIAFEIIEPDSLKKEHIIDLIKCVDSKNIIFYCNRVEVDSVYKILMDLRLQLSIQQIPDKSICFVLSIRENILEKHKRSMHSNNIYTIDINENLSTDEIGELVDKLAANQLISIRDVHERNDLVGKVRDKLGSDPFITMLDLVSNGKHIRDLRDAYEELSEKCQYAFVNTALLHRFGILMPSGLLNNIVASDWNEFTEKVIKVEGKGILIHDYSNSKGKSTDLFFKTKHPQIAERLVQEVLKNSDSRLKYYQNIINCIDSTSLNSKLIVNLFKALKGTNEFGDRFMNKLYDLAYKKFQEEPYFLLHYCKNLQYRGTKDFLKKAVDIMVYADSLLDRKNDKFIHRRALLNFELAKLYYKEENELSLTITYLEEAKDLFLLKQQLDPTSSFSYYDYLTLLMWELDNVVLEPETELKLKIKIEDNFNLAVNAVTGGIAIILELQERYEREYRQSNNYQTYLQKLDEFNDNYNLRPLALILKYNFLNRIQAEFGEQSIILEELDFFKDDDVAIFLFREYGRRLYDPNIRIKFFSLSKSMVWYGKHNPLRYNYFNYVAASYNRNFHEARLYLENIQDQYHSLNPEYKLKWKDVDGATDRIFEGNVIRTAGKGYAFKSTELQRRFKFARENFRKLRDGESCSVKLHFYLFGISAVLQPVSTLED
ncbi:hypothetical protein GCM10027341_35620 [Spirosoma knui]